jgi:hypothetical protein
MASETLEQQQSARQRTCRPFGFNDLLSGATGAALTLLGGFALTAAGVAVLAVGAMALVVAPALWILRDGAARRRGPRFTNDYVRRTPCTHTSQ